MVDVVPFRGLLFNQGKTGSLANVTAPPYDVIAPGEQEALYQKSPYNVVRLILGKEFPSDGETDNRYTRSARAFREWTEAGILVRDPKPVFYVYSQEYSFEGKTVRRIGFFARVKLEDFSAGNICPHEFTLDKPKKDRALLLQACRANFSPIFGLFSDPDGGVDRGLERTAEREPITVVEEQSITHRFWRLEDEETIAFLSREFAGKRIYIADGHHRYETALAYYKENGDKIKDSAYVMFFLTSLDSPSLIVHPIHRQVRCPFPFNREKFLAALCEFFEIRPLPENAPPEKIKAVLRESGKSAISFCVYLKDGLNRLLLLRLEDPGHLIPYLDPDDPRELAVLDVAQLHALAIRTVLKIDSKKAANQQYLAYTIHIDEAIGNVNAGKYNLAFFLNPTPIAQVKELAEKGVRLPQKSTYFYPKLLSGLAINPFEA